MSLVDLNVPKQGVAPFFDAVSAFAERESERYSLHTRYMNEMMVRVLKTIGFDIGFQRGTGQYLFDRSGVRYLDLLSGWGVFGIGRNHPKLREALTAVLAGDLPNLVQMDVAPLAGILAERLLRYAPFLQKVFFTNSGAEAVEASIKFARKATGRPGLVYCTHAFHGLSYGALSLNGDNYFRDKFGPFLPHCAEVPFNELAPLERALSTREVAAFIVEPIQGKSVNIPDGGRRRRRGRSTCDQTLCSSFLGHGWFITGTADGSDAGMMAILPQRSHAGSAWFHSWRFAQLFASVDHHLRSVSARTQAIWLDGECPLHAFIGRNANEFA